MKNTIWRLINMNIKGRPTLFNDEYIEEVFNDYILNNTDANITPTSLSKWSTHHKWQEKWKDGKVKEIPRTIWYRDKWKAKIEEYNNIPFVLRVEQLDKMTPFKIDKIINKNFLNKKELKNALKDFENRGNIALKIAVENQKFKDKFEEIQSENEKILALNEELNKKVEFYKNKCEELVLDSYSISERKNQGIKENFFSSYSKSKETLADEVNIQKMKEGVVLRSVEVKVSEINQNEITKYDFLDDNLKDFFKE
jgi:hypothetical protein